MVRSRAGVEVVQDQVGHPSRPLVGQQRPVHQRDPEAPAAQDGESHDGSSRLVMTSTPDSRRQPSVSGSVAGSVTTAARSPGPQTRAMPLPGNLPASATQHGPLGRLEHRALHGDLDGGRVEHAAVAPYAAGAEEQHVGVDLADRLLGQEADQRAVVAAHHASQHDELHRFVVGQLLVDRQAGGDDRDVAPAQGPGEVVGRRPDVHEQHVAVAHQPGRHGSHPVLGVLVVDRDDLEGRFGGAERSGAAVHPSQHALGLEVGQVATHRRPADTELAGEGGHLGRTGRAQPLEDVVVAAPGEHAHKVAGRNDQE